MTKVLILLLNVVRWWSCSKVPPSLFRFSSVLIVGKKTWLLVGGLRQARDRPIRLAKPSPPSIKAIFGAWMVNNASQQRACCCLRLETYCRHSYYQLKHNRIQLKLNFSRQRSKNKNNLVLSTKNSVCMELLLWKLCSSTMSMPRVSGVCPTPLLASDNDSSLFRLFRRTSIVSRSSSWFVACSRANGR